MMSLLVSKLGCKYQLCSVTKIQLSFQTIRLLFLWLFILLLDYNHQNFLKIFFTRNFLTDGFWLSKRKTSSSCFQLWNTWNMTPPQTWTKMCENPFSDLPFPKSWKSAHRIKFLSLMTSSPSTFKCTYLQYCKWFIWGIMGIPS